MANDGKTRAQWVEIKSGLTYNFCMNLDLILEYSYHRSLIFYSESMIGAVHKQSWQLGGGRGGVKNWSKLSIDSTKKLPIWGRGVSKIQKHC